MLTEAFGPNSIAIEAGSPSWEQALGLVVGLLEADSRVTADYLTEVLGANQKLGPYFVIAPGIALAHAAPSVAVLQTGFALLRLDQPVSSGSNNDPVRLLFAFCAVDSSSHIELLGEFARTMSEPEKVNLLLNASDVTQIRNLFGTGLVK